MDDKYYKALGLNRNASKEEIKEAYRKLAVKYHPDKHSQSTQAVRDTATLKFKQVSEAYDRLIHNHHPTPTADHNNYKRYGYNSHGYNNNRYGYGNTNYNSYTNSYCNPASASNLNHGFQIAFRFLSTRAFLLNVAFASALIGGTVIVEMSRDALWKTHNSGKSFEEALVSIEKAKAHKDEM